jgi:cobalt-zinc-cadmium efflux system outer membrane protein
VHNANLVGLSLDLPFWNRNQGNIRAAENRLRASTLRAEQAPRQLESEILEARRELLEADSLYGEWKEPFAERYDALADGIYLSYLRRSIGLLEFVNFLQAYKESKSRLFNLQNGRIHAFENLNFATGKDLFRFD